MVQLGHRMPLGQAPPQGGGDTARAAALADGHVAAPQRRRRVAQGGPGPHGRDELGLVVAALQADQLAEGGAARRWGRPAARRCAGSRPGRRGGVTEDAVHPAGVEPEAAQALLELGHVVAPQHGRAPVQEAVAQPKTGLDQGVPGLRAADAVDPQAAVVLEGLDGGPGGGPEDAVRVDRRAGQDGRQAVLDVGDRVAAVADGERQAYR